MEQTGQEARAAMGGAADGKRSGHPPLVAAIAGPALGALLLMALGSGLSGETVDPNVPEAPKIEAVSMLPEQLHRTDPAVIWYDDFNHGQLGYTESSGPIDSTVGFGPGDYSMRCDYPANSQGIGGRKVFFGDSPTGQVVKPGRKHQEIYWRIYVRHRYGWTGGGPAKMSRATSIVSGNWAQAMISHVWSSDSALTLDPASGVYDKNTGLFTDRVFTTKYNDFDNLKWLGNRPTSELKISSRAESGWWVCVEARARLNTPGQKDGVNQLWIDGKLEAERTGLDWRGSYDSYGINAVFLEAYWNERSPVSQSRWYDNFVISTEPIGPVVTPRNPVLHKMPYHGPGAQAAWEAEVAADPAGGRVVWRSNPVTAGDSVRVDTLAGGFTGRLQGRTALDPGQRYLVRVRQQSDNGQWSQWSRWHQYFVTDGATSGHAVIDCDFNDDGRADLADVVDLLLFQHGHPVEARGDYDRDGRYSIMDALRLVLDLMNGNCAWTSWNLLAAAGGDRHGVERLESLGVTERRYVEERLRALPLEPELKAPLLEALFAGERPPRLPRGFALAQNTPNPFNPNTTISFQIPEGTAPSRVSLRVFDLGNRLVRTLADGVREAGAHLVYWDGNNELGQPAASGIYLYRLECGEFSQTRKMVLLR